MKLPYSWLKDFTDVGIHNVPAKQYAADMTMAGTMVGSWESPADEIYQTFGVSKKIFKKGIGDLYKRRLIEIGENCLILIRALD